jgi:hypothetical protein
MAANTPATGSICKPREYWDIDEVANHFGVHRSTIFRWMRDNGLKAKERNAPKDKLLFPIVDVMAFIPPADKK